MPDETFCPIPGTHPAATTSVTLSSFPTPTPPPGDLHHVRTRFRDLKLSKDGGADGIPTKATTSSGKEPPLTGLRADVSRPAILPEEKE